jgi:3-hydroxyisobutyrate dehydrogenase-like beta-hydroxyacid dehydrogenase
VKTGFIGLGQMGAAMAKHLVNPLVFDVRSEATRPFESVAATVAEIGERCDVVSVAVFDDAQVREVVGELETTAKPDTIVAIHSTISPGTAEELAADARDIEIVDAPITGGPMGAAEGALVVMAGGSEAAVGRCRERFAWASRVVHAGPVGAGTRMKLAKNLITYAAFAAVGEAQRLAEAAGIDLIELGNVVRQSDKITGGPGAVMFRDSTQTAAADDPWHSTLLHTRDLAEKDLALALELGRELGIELPIANLALAQIADALGVPHER